MKKNVMFLIILHLLFACNTPEIEEESNVITVETNKQSGRTAFLRRYYSKNSLVVKFASWVTRTDKAKFRNLYNVSSYQTCSKCLDEAIELWMFDASIDIEPKKESINNTPPPSGFPKDPQGRPAIEYVEFNYDITVDSKSKLEVLSATKLALPAINYGSYLVPNNQGVTIAVMDTGINPGLGATAQFPSKFLYNSILSGTAGVYSGWDYVNNDHDCTDDDPNQHGTAVTSVITRQLTSYGIPYQIMPLKVCNSLGKGSYFNLLCSLNFALERKVDIVQMSLGWYNLNGNIADNIFTNLVNRYSTAVPNLIIVCSAGNDGDNILINSNNDSNYHYPSSFGLHNIIAVAACKSDYTNISSFSNYGATSVDFFAKGEDIPFLGTSIRGTSFAAPAVAAKIALFKHQNTTNYGALEYLINAGMPIDTSFDNSRPVKYHKIILP